MEVDLYSPDADTFMDFIMSISRYSRNQYHGYYKSGSKYPFVVCVKVAQVYRSKTNNLTVQPNIIEVVIACGVSQGFVSSVEA